MAHRIGRTESIAKALVRLARDDLDRAAADLKAADRRQERVHSVRQRLKRVRTILRVIEPRFGAAAVAARRTIAEAARLLARARDADVAAENARSLAAMSAPGDDHGFDRVVEVLEREADEAHQRRTPIGDVNARLAAARRAIAAFDADFDGRGLLASALSRAYGKGRKAMRRARTSLATPDLHRWRKTVKHLWHLMLLARARLPKKSRRAAARLDRLGELLGSDNDHALLAEKLALSPAGDPKLMSQLGVIARQRNALEAKAFGLGQRLFVRKPKAFARRFRVR
jgi:CHAD domain-containing protein